MLFLKERIGRLLKDLESFCYPQEMPILEYKMHRSQEVFSDLKNLDTSAWETFDTKNIWGGHREYFWFETIVTIPEKFNNQCVCYKLITGREGAWDAINPQFTIYVNGELVQGLDVNHTEILLTKKAKTGEQYQITLSAFTGDQNFSLCMDSKLRVLDIETEHYYYDCKVPYDVALLLPEDSGDYISIITSLNESLNLLDLRQEYSDAYYQSLKAAQSYLTEEFYQKRCGDQPVKAYCVGHTHIDVAWLWTLAVTEDKVARSFSTVLELMRQYPEYVFMSSQPQLYEFVKKNQPALYTQIKQRIVEKRWEPDGAMWVEADCNLASGESLVRQFLYGIRFFEQEFGIKNEILWLPDVFGYSAALPQIMQKCGIPYFMTTKISWNEINQLPYDTFEWEGIDGSKVLTHFISARDYIGNGGFTANENSYEHEFFTTYNAYINPKQIKGTWQRYQQKNLNSQVLVAFGYGDGGGGATKEQLEIQRRLAQGIPGAPQTVMSSAKDYFHLLDKEVRDNKYLPLWVGELYLEYHRGTYTSMARNKKYNRKNEFIYQNAELFHSLAGQLSNHLYPKDQIRNGWKIILLNQFHDILPGSSIKEVYDESKEQYEAIQATGQQLLNTAMEEIVQQINSPQYSVVVFNPNGQCSNEIITFTCPASIKNPIIYDRDQMLPVQKTDSDQWIFSACDLPSKGYKTFLLKDAEETFSSSMKATTKQFDNDYFNIQFNEKGQFSSIFDKRANREILQHGQIGNVIMSYEDRPHNYDAWDINNYYDEKSWEVDNISSIEVIESGPVRSSLRIQRTYLDSTISQTISIYQNIARIDIQNDVDWKQKQILLKLILPLNIQTNEATFDIQYGNVKRHTHANTSWDIAKFEVCMHKWLDLSEYGYGVSILNDCKYGASVRDSVVGLTMLKSGTYPNPVADQERHQFTYSIFPHENGWREANTVTQAYQINNPSIAIMKSNDSGLLPSTYSMIQCDNKNVVIEVVKQAEDSNETIVRLYECYQQREQATLNFHKNIKSIVECDMLENSQSNIPFAKNSAQINITPYEIKTLKISFE